MNDCPGEYIPNISSILKWYSRDYSSEALDSKRKRGSRHWLISWRNEGSDSESISRSTTPESTKHVDSGYSADRILLPSFF